VQGIADERSLLAERLRARSAEICQAILDRLHGMEEESPTRDYEYLKGLREAVSCGLDFALDVVAQEEQRLPIPLAIVTQARLAARHELELDLVLRRYLAAKTVFTEVLLQEASLLSETNLLPNVTSTLDALLDRVLAVAAEEYRREKRALDTARNSHLTHRVQRLLWGQRGADDLDYQLRQHHVGLAVKGQKASPALRACARAADAALLIVEPRPELWWAWLGRRRPFNTHALDQLAEEAGRRGLVLAIGEEATGVDGWRLTHRQAAAALPIACTCASVVRYVDVALEASVLSDPLLVNSFRQLYLAPLSQERDGGDCLKETLRAYFATQRNGASAAASLKVSRQTVTNRLRVCEDRIGQPLSRCATSLELALSLEEIEITGLELKP
jgi:hypothetical protein